MSEVKKTTTVGRAEKVYLLGFDDICITAKIDTGADLSSIWATNIHIVDGDLQFTLFGPSSPYYSGRVYIVKQGEYSVTRVANSFGQREIRYVVKVRIRLAGRVLKATFTLSNRSKKTYPVLLGRKLLKGKFVVDVKRGDPLHVEEKIKRQKMHLELGNYNDKLGA